MRMLCRILCTQCVCVRARLHPHTCTSLTRAHAHRYVAAISRSILAALCACPRSKSSAM